MTDTTTTAFDVRTDDGTAPCWLVRPPGESTLPGVVFFADAGGVRPAMHEMASRLASLGYVVLMPEPFYRHGAYQKFDMATVFSVQSERDRIMGMIRSLDATSATRDAACWFRTLRAQPGVAAKPVGCIGYCMGGRMAFMAAGRLPNEVGAAAAIHAGHIATDAPDSPHLAAPAIAARLYFGVADRDPSCTPAAQARLVEALSTSHVRYALDHYAGVQHGFAVPDFPVYDRGAAERHWQRAAELFATL